jgi:hypothetical protein
MKRNVTWQLFPGRDYVKRTQNKEKSMGQANIFSKKQLPLVL